MYTCAKCTQLACGMESHQHLPNHCPMRDQSIMDGALASYKTCLDFYKTSSEIEGIGYGKWTRLKETIALCKRMEYTRIGMAFCQGLREEARTINDILHSHGLEVVSVICKTGGVSKEKVGVDEQYKLHPGEFEPMCNPIAQAMLLNRQQTQFNIAVGLCVGHDSLFLKYSEALATVLIAKDRVLAHNPAGAVYCASGYYRNHLSPSAEER